MRCSRRETLALLTTSVLSGILPRLARASTPDDLYDIGKFGNARVIHITDTHAQTAPVYFREPSINIGVGQSAGRPPHLVGESFLKHFGIPDHTRSAHAFTFLDFEEVAHLYGRMGGFAHLKTLVDRYRTEAGPGNSVLLDGGDLWQGSALAHFTDGMAMVELSNLFGVDAMTGHWEFTYGEEQLRKNLAAFKGEFIAQNVFLTDEASFNGAPSFDSKSGRVFRPYIMKELGGARIAIIGQAFPYLPIAHPQRFVSDWTFGVHDKEMQQIVNEARGKGKADAVILLSHNGMDVDLKLASLVTGIDVILGGHTHDTTPRPSVVANASGKTLVTNGGTSGKFIGILDLDAGGGRVKDVRYMLVPVFSNLVKPDPAVMARLQDMNAPFKDKLSEKLGNAGELLFRRGNFNGTMDDVICDALRAELDAEIALSPGFRWGPSLLSGDTITMDDLLSHTAITYPDVYVQQMTGADLKSVLEDVCDNLFNKDPYLQQGGDMVRLGGMNYTCAPTEDIGRRISAMTLDNGKTIEPGKTYKVAGWASVNLPQNGRPVWDVLSSHMRHARTIAPLTQNKVTVTGIAGNPGYSAP